MFSKLVKGELSLAETFWKFGVLGLIVLNLFVRIFGYLLSGYLQGRSINEYFFHHFHVINSPKLGILWTLCYVTSLIILAIYSWNIVLAVWRSSAKYEKSGILSFLAKIFIIAIVAFIWRRVLLPVI
ncbi:MAG: hypothetical protein E7012_04775 [Alphaproteobacteria bacterium]|nr:hypothetical protein [Alphaproteobacteria bacterium]